jgi:hypothetical protein
MSIGNRLLDAVVDDPVNDLFIDNGDVIVAYVANSRGQVFQLIRIESNYHLINAFPRREIGRVLLKALELDRVYIRPEYRGTRLCTSMVREALRSAFLRFQSRPTPLTLHVSSHMPQEAIACYSRAYETFGYKLGASIDHDPSHYMDGNISMNIDSVEDYAEAMNAREDVDGPWDELFELDYVGDRYFVAPPQEFIDFLDHPTTIPAATWTFSIVDTRSNDDERVRARLQVDVSTTSKRVRASTRPTTRALANVVTRVARFIDDELQPRRIAFVNNMIP